MSAENAQTHHAPAELVAAATAAVVPADGRKKVRQWPVPQTAAPFFVELFLDSPRFRQEVLTNQAVAQASRDAYDAGLAELPAAKSA